MDPVLGRVLIELQQHIERILEASPQNREPVFTGDVEAQLLQVLLPTILYAPEGGPEAQEATVQLRALLAPHLTARDTEEVLSAFRTYYDIAELSATTDLNLVYNLRAKLDAAGYYDDFEVDRVVEAEIKGVKQSELVAAIAPVEDRLMKRYKAAQEALKAAKTVSDEKAS